MPTTVVAPGLDILAGHFGLSLVDQDGNAVTVEASENKEDESTDEKEEESPAGPAPPVGSLCSSVPIYQGEPDESGRMTWSAEEPENIPEAAENENTVGHAIVIRNAKSEDSRKKYAIHSIVVQSPHLRKALATIFDGYPGISCNLTRLTFDAPFQPFVHRWQQFLDYMNQEHEDPAMGEHLKLLHSILSAELGETIKALEDYIKHGVVTFEHVWTIFVPGSILVAPCLLGMTVAAEFTYGHYSQSASGEYFSIESRCIDCDGEKGFGWTMRYFRLPKFRGVVEINSLSILPLSFCANEPSLTQTLIRRGKKFEELAGFHYKSYSDYAIEVVEDHRGEVKDKVVHLNGRIVVDPDSWNTHNVLFAESLVYLHEDPGPGPVGADEDADIDGDDDSDSDTDSFDRVSNNGKIYVEDTGKKLHKLTDRQRLLASNLVRGYSLKLKKWLKFSVDAVEAIEWSSHAFDSLVLPEQQKDLVLALSQNQIAGAGGFDDIIQGKGRGMILLLTGPPGVGKTLTAESTAEQMRVPLFTMGAGDLGTRSYEVEEKLNSILSLVAKWKAILLIDECDVFLEARSIHDLERNKLVSIFLRLLEYYEGILFLTTNRVANMDPAFQSRIHLTIAYDHLSTSSRRRIWLNFVTEMKYRTDFAARDLDALAKLDLNGRQIKNIIKSAQLVAFSKKEPLGKKHVDVILAIEDRKTAQ